MHRILWRMYFLHTFDSLSELCHQSTYSFKRCQRLYPDALRYSWWTFWGNTPFRSRFSRVRLSLEFQINLYIQPRLMDFILLLVCLVKCLKNLLQGQYFCLSSWSCCAHIWLFSRPLPSSWVRTKELPLWLLTKCLLLCTLPPSKTHSDVPMSTRKERAPSFSIQNSASSLKVYLILRLAVQVWDIRYSRSTYHTDGRIMKFSGLSIMCYIYYARTLLSSNDQRATFALCVELISDPL